MVMSRRHLTGVSTVMGALWVEAPDFLSLLLEPRLSLYLIELNPASPPDF